MFNEYSNLTTEQKAIEYIKCKNNIFYFIYNYVYIPEIGGSLKYTPEHMHLKLKRVIRSAIKFDKVIFMASRQLGKALSLDTLIPLPNGSYTTIDKLKIGDIILGADGKPTTVKFITDVMYNHNCYKINFDYADSIIADADHLWKINDGEITTTEKLFDLREKYIKVTEPIQFLETNQPIHPYVYGLWLSANINDGNKISIPKKITNEVYRNIVERDYISTIEISKNRSNSENNIDILNFKTKLLDNKLLEQRISEQYLVNSIENRIELLQGIMDGSGHCDLNGRCQIKHSNLTFLFDIKQLLSTLGIKNKINQRQNVYTKKYSLTFSTKDYIVFKIEERKKRQLELKGTRYNKHYIKSIEKIESVPVKCIQVDNEDKMFLAGEYIPTHNSTIAAIIIEYMLNFFPKNRAIIINMKKSAALENLSKIKFIHEMLPDFLKPCISNKVLADRKTYLEYENGSKVDVFYPSSISGPEQIARSLTSPILYIDESAFINHIHSAYGAAQPILSKARIQAKKHG
jgi:hypothetical protein